jgi:ATP-dependent DNA ligase
MRPECCTGAWIKLKLHQEQEFVIGGYTEPEGSRKYFGALLVGFYEGRNLNLLAESELALAINFYAVSFLNWKKSRLNNAPSLTSRQQAGAVGTKD